MGVAPLPGRVTAARVAVPDGGPPACQKVRKKLDGTEDVIERFQRVDRALVAAVSETCATGSSTRRVQRVAQKMGVDRLSED